MKIRRSIAAAGAAVVLSATGALALPAVASAHNASTTLKFTAVTNKSHSFARTIFINQETDVSSTGKTIGFDVVYVKVTGGTKATANAAFDFKGGLLYATAITTDGGKTFTGKVTGGTGAFKGATGTLTGKSVANNKTSITIVYS
jgi:hypothetical protein